MIQSLLQSAAALGMMVAPASVAVYRLSKHSDPLTCGCLHMPGVGCPFYKWTENDPRGFAHKAVNKAVDESASKVVDETKVSSSPENFDTPKIPHIIYILDRVGEAALRVMLLPWLVSRFSKHYANLETCNCAHSKNCMFAPKKVLIAPIGCEGWTYREGGFVNPTGDKWTIGIEVDAPARKNLKYKKHLKKMPVSIHASSSAREGSNLQI